jgi:hypothetical protein
MTLPPPNHRFTHRARVLLLALGAGAPVAAGLWLVATGTETTDKVRSEESRQVGDRGARSDTGGVRLPHVARGLDGNPQGQVTVVPGERPRIVATGTRGASGGRFGHRGRGTGRGTRAGRASGPMWCLV